MEFLILFITLIIGVKIGWDARERHATRVLAKLVEEFEEEVQEKESDKILISIERHSGIFFVYNKETNEFMGQGNTKEELEKTLQSRFPGKRFAASDQDLKVLYDSI